jgi:hypothetical protein
MSVLNLSSDPQAYYMRQIKRFARGMWGEKNDLIGVHHLTKGWKKLDLEPNEKYETEKLMLRQAGIAWHGDKEPENVAAKDLDKIERLKAVMEGLDDVAKWVFYYVFFSHMLNTPTLKTDDGFTWFSRVAGTVIQSGFRTYWDPTNYIDSEAFEKVFGEDAKIEKISDIVKAENERYLQAQRDSRAKFSRAQIVEALRKTGGDSKLAAAQLLRG